MATIILYWSNVPSKSGIDSCDEWRESEVKFSASHDLVFKSHERLVNNVELWTHQKVTDFPYDNIKIKDAGEIVPHEIAFNAMSMGHSIAFISDTIRLKRASQTLGIVLDMDAVCLKKFPEHDSWFSTFVSKKTGGMVPQWGPKKPPMTVHDGSWDGKELTAFPIKVGKTTQQKISDLSDWILNKIQTKHKGTTNEWNSILWTVKAIANEDTTAKVYEPIYMNPIPPWLGAGKCYSIESPTRLDGTTHIFGHKMPSIDEILEKSYSISHFYESAFQDASLTEDDFWTNLPRDCLLSKECDIIGYKPKRSSLEDFFLIKRLT